MRLNGWQPSWVVASALYLCLGVVYAIYTQPSPENIFTSDLYNLHHYLPSPESRPNKWIPLEQMAKIAPPTAEEMTQRQKAAEEYQRAVQERVGQRRQEHLLAAVLLIAGPIILVYILGRSIAWVYAGFKHT